MLWFPFDGYNAIPRVLREEQKKLSYIYIYHDNTPDVITLYSLNKTSSYKSSYSEINQEIVLDLLK